MADLEQIANALRAADAAGNVEDARRLADAYASAMTRSTSQGSPASSATLLSDLPGVPREQLEAENRARQATYDPAAALEAELTNKTQYFQSLPAALRGAIGAGSRVAKLGRGLGQAAGIVTNEDEALARSRERYMEGDLAASTGKVAADIGMALAPATKVAAIPNLGTRILANAGVGAIYGGAAPTVDGESAYENAAIGGLFGAGGELAAKGLGSVASSLRSNLSAPVRELYEAAARRGIELTPAQLSDSRLLQYLGARLKEYPFSGARGVADRQRSAFNAELARLIGADAKAITPDVFADAKRRTSLEFERLAQGASLPITPDVVDRLGRVVSEATEIADAPVAKAANAFVSRVMQQAKDGVLPGSAYQSIDSSLGKAMKAGGEKAAYLGEIRDALRESMDDAIPASMQEAWRQARRQWASQKAIEPLVAKTTDGVLSPAELMGRVTASKAGKALMASGRGGDLGELARIGQKLKDPPTSGTPQGALSESLLNPLNWLPFAARTAMGATLGRIPNSPVAGRMVVNDSPAKGLTALSRLLPGIGLGAAPIITPKERKRLRPRD